MEYVKRPEAAGIDRRPAEAHAAAVRDTLATQLATKADIGLLKADLDTAVVRLEARIDRVEARLDRVEQKFDAKFVLTHWMLGFQLALTAGVLWRLLR